MTLDIPTSFPNSRRLTADSVNHILQTRGLSLASVSRESVARYPQNSAYHIPQNFYYDLSLPTFSPRLEQVVALSRIANYRLVDWLAVFGFHLDDIPRLQAILAGAQTTLLDATVYDREAWIPWFHDREPGALPSQVPIAPLTRLLAPETARRASSFLGSPQSPFLYAKVGYQDAFAFPDLLPGSIVRIDSRRREDVFDGPTGTTTRRLFLVEHAKGLVCCRLSLAARNRITICSNELPYAQAELQLTREARILGVLDLELRFLVNSQPPQVPPQSGAFWKPLPLASGSALDFGQLIRQARLRAGLSLRAASAQSRAIAQMLGDDGYFCASGALSNYETKTTVPRHIHKLITISIVYLIRFSELLQSADLEAELSGHEPIPDWLVRRLEPRHFAATFGTSGEGGFLSGLTEEFEEIPLFLRHALPAVLGLPDFSLRNIYWVGGERNSLHPYLSRALVVIVDPRNKRPVLARTRPLWDQPIYVLLKRNGTHLCAGCSLENGALIVHPFSDGSTRPERLRNKVDVEIVGKIVAIVRKL